MMQDTFWLQVNRSVFCFVLDTEDFRENNILYLVTHIKPTHSQGTRIVFGSLGSLVPVIDMFSYKAVGKCLFFIYNDIFVYGVRKVVTLLCFLSSLNE